MADEGQQMKTIVGHNIVVFFTFFLIIFTTAVQIFLIQAEIGMYHANWGLWASKHKATYESEYQSENRT